MCDWEIWLLQSSGSTDLFPGDKSCCQTAASGWHSLGQTNPTGSEPVWHTPAHGVPHSSMEIQRLKLAVTAITLFIFTFTASPFKNIYLQRKSESPVMTIEKRAQNHVWPSNLQFPQPLRYMRTSSTNISQKNDILIVSEPLLCNTTLMLLWQKNALLLNPYSQFPVLINNFCIHKWTRKCSLNLEEKMTGAACQPVCTSWAPEALPTSRLYQPRHSWYTQCLLTTPTGHTHLSNYSWLHHSFSL